MATEVKLPELGENIDSGTVVKLLVTVGQKIDQDQPVLELETDKATIEVPSPAGGTVKEIRVQEGAKAQVGETVMVLEDGAPAKQSSRKTKSPSKAKEAKSEEPAPQEKEEVPKESDLEGARSEKGREAPVPTEKPAEEKKTEEPAEEKSKKQEPETKPEEEAPAEEMEAEIEIHEATVYHPTSQGAAKVVAASPSVRRTAREIGIDISDVPGSGPGGRVSVDDVKEFARQLHRGGGREGAPSIPAAHIPDFSRWGKVERQPMSNIREKTAERMAVAWANVPTVTQYDKADITRLEEYRKNFGPKVEAAGGKLTVTAVLLKVIASALKNFPQFNASVDSAQKDIIFKKYFHIGVAVDTDRGLLVPVIRDVDRKNIIQLSVELTQLAEKARNRKLSIEEMQGGSFTITNLGGIGGTNFSPIVNFPEVAILGISRSSVEPVFANGEFEPRTMLPLSLSYDHRIIDGADAARFLRWVCEAIRDPFLIALEG